MQIGNVLMGLSSKKRDKYRLFDACAHLFLRGIREH